LSISIISWMKKKDLKKQGIITMNETMKKRIRREARQEELEWSEISLEWASRDIEDDDIPDYTEADLKEKWK